MTDARAQPRTALRRFASRFVRHRPGVIGAVVLGVLVLAAIFGPLLWGSDPNAVDVAPGAPLAPPSWAHPFGTDESGRDWLARALHGARISLSVASAAMIVSVGLGTVVGTLGGYFGGKLDAALMRTTDVILALPLFFLLLIAQSLLEPNALHLVWLIGVTSWMGVARIVRAEVLAIKTTEYIVAAAALGVSHRRRIARHVLPNALGPIVVAATLSVGHCILAEAALSYLGLGVPPPDASWGNMLQRGITQLQLAPWLVLFPGALIFATVLAVNHVGDAMRQTLDAT